MAIEIHPEDIPDAEVIDVEEVSRREQMMNAAKARAQQASAALGEQRVRVFARISAWYATADVTDEDLAREIERKRRSQTKHGEVELGARVKGLKLQLRHADPEMSGALAFELAGAEAQLQALKETDADNYKISGRDLGRARWSKKAGRLALSLGGAYGYVNGVAVEPLLALASLGAAPFAWWYLSRPTETQQPKAEVAPFIPGQAVPVEGVGTDGTPVPAPMSTPSGQFVPDTLSSLGRVSLVKPESARVQGEGDLVTALVKAGIISEAQRDQTHLAGVIQPSGPGWTATIELPRGMPASNAIGKLEELASAMRIKRSRIEIRPDNSADGHDGRLVLWVADQDNPYGSGKTDSELIAAKRWDFWKDGIPLGPDARNNRHTLDLIWSSIMIGGLMGYGKSYLARLIAAAAALDPTVRIIVITGKTGPDWAPLKNVAHQWIAGASPDIIRKVLRVMDTTITEMQDRGTELDRLYEVSPEKVPEGKVTPELAADGMGPVLLVVDELQELLDGAALVQVAIDEETTPEGGRPKTKNARDILVDSFARYVRVTRFVLGMGVFITQRPSSDSVPTKLRDVCAKRGSFRVKGQNSAKMVLGDDPVNQGAAPHLLGEDSKGVVVLELGDEAGHITIKADVIDLPAFKDICLRGRDLRLAAGTLTGDALEYGKVDQAAAATATLLADCIAALDANGVDRARTETLLGFLAAYKPGAYGELTGPQLQARLREAGAGGTRKLGACEGLANPNGYTRDQLTEAGK
ncbi:hypothetical protein PV721_17785 [Streptomyces sp. MB09-01]|uniref:hypothetical protein n=1 Tax=Streptomyces sp. MB09-01 TaxID=3028666 RepID=UPI0029B4B901|nr:hypothetical protein [Streptomyces sp. MB09-01]MDX3536191.1 hypothetical protein [Streptomyces sp. MB09-01]